MNEAYKSLDSAALVVRDPQIPIQGAKATVAGDAAVELSLVARDGSFGARNLFSDGGYQQAHEAIGLIRQAVPGIDGFMDLKEERAASSEHNAMKLEAELPTSPPSSEDEIASGAETPLSKPSALLPPRTQRACQPQRSLLLTRS